MAELRCIVVTPEATALEENASFVAVPLYDGELGIGVDHTPLIGRLGFGELRLGRGAQVARYYVDGGFVQVADNVVSILTGRAVPAGQLNPETLRAQLAAAKERPATSPELLEIRSRLVAQARAQLRVATRSS